MIQTVRWDKKLRPIYFCIGMATVHLQSVRRQAFAATTAPLQAAPMPPPDSSDIGHFMVEVKVDLSTAFRVSSKLETTIRL